MEYFWMGYYGVLGVMWAHVVVFGFFTILSLVVAFAAVKFSK